MLRRPPTSLRLDVGISPEEVAERLRSSMAIVKSFLLSPAWGRREDLIGQVDRTSFRMRVRHAYSNGLTRLVYGTITPTPFGSRIEGRFRTLRFVVLILRGVWLVFLLAMAAHVQSVLRYAREGGTPNWVELAVALLVPGATLAFLIMIEIIARRLGDRDEETLREHLTRMFADVRR